MTEHYYTAKPEAAHQREQIELDINGILLSLVTDASVFSRNEVDPGTRLLLKSIDAPQVGLILDMGCGYGPIGLYYAAKCPQCQVHMSDVNERAVSLSQENALRNKLSNVVIHCGDGFNPLSKMQFDLIVTNPPIRAGKGFLLQLFKEALTHLKPGGQLAFVARTQQGAKTLAREVQNIFGNIEDVARGGGYRIYRAVRSV